ncbi:hypothetical protein [Pseudoxanthomonas sacheonensis]|uniref:Fatty acid desaturase n=1 Tax=Pseudoxanthomonas sacheonensis TaxID=443615 RepID=A0ABU1RS87_9GAMM|nr:hypothetical protein [Pseudoxanthomonas sacheonensis]MDR6841634.1 fatty acid desaturase [Pseudoxanthomonas sacheonensis]
MTAPRRPAASSTENDLAARRKRALRTALVIGAIAVAIYVAFILSGVAAA